MIYVIYYYKENFFPVLKYVKKCKYFLYLHYLFTLFIFIFYIHIENLGTLIFKNDQSVS